MSKEKEKPLNIFQRIHKVMEAVDYIQKSEKRVNNQYRFVSHDHVTKIMHKHFVDHGIVMIPSVESYTAVQIAIKAKGEMRESTRTEATIIVRFVNIDDPNDFVQAKYVGFGIDDSDKGIGKAMSYACKYAMLKVFCLETGEADVEDDQETRQVSVIKPGKPPVDWECISDEQKGELEGLFNLCDDTSKELWIKGIEKRYKIPSFSAVPVEAFETVKNSLIRQAKKDLAKEQPTEPELNEEVASE